MKALTPHANAVVVGQVLNSAANMVKEIAHYKRYIAELEYQREQMHEQAKITHLQIESQHQQAMHRIDHLSTSFKETMQQNEMLIRQHVQREKEVTQNITLILQQISQSNDLETKKLLQQILHDFMQQININRDESARLQAQLMDAHQQFGLSLSHRDQTFKDVY